MTESRPKQESRVKARALQEVFEVDRKTMKRWGGALQEGDPEKLIAVLAGRSRGKKITPGIEGFVRTRFESLHRDHPRNYSAVISRRHSVRNGRGS